MVLIIYEYPNVFRWIPLDGRAHEVDPDPTWYGYAIGHWEGDTIIYIHKKAINSLVERKTKFVALTKLEQKTAEPLSASERFAAGLGHTIYTAMLGFLREHRADIQNRETAQAAE